MTIDRDVRHIVVTGYEEEASQAEIAERVNEAGFKTTRGYPFTASTISSVARELGMRRKKEFTKAKGTARRGVNRPDLTPTKKVAPSKDTQLELMREVLSLKLVSRDVKKNLLKLIVADMRV